MDKNISTVDPLKEEMAEAVHNGALRRVKHAELVNMVKEDLRMAQMILEVVGGTLNPLDFKKYRGEATVELTAEKLEQFRKSTQHGLYMLYTSPGLIEVIATHLKGVHDNYVEAQKRHQANQAQGKIFES